MAKHFQMSSSSLCLGVVHNWQHFWKCTPEYTLIASVVPLSPAPQWGRTDWGRPGTSCPWGTRADSCGTPPGRWPDWRSGQCWWGQWARCPCLWGTERWGEHQGWCRHNRHWPAWGPLVATAAIILLPQTVYSFSLLTCFDYHSWLPPISIIWHL